jgi:sugar O-acyltransferase (sialic acid O-acetyltransferase NeuD family)
MTTPLLILGAGGNSFSIMDAVEETNRLAGKPVWTIAGFLDDLLWQEGKSVGGYAILGPITRAPEFPDCRLINGISSVESFRKRSDVVARTRAESGRFATVVHPRAVVSPRAAVGQGCAILAGSVVGPGAILDDHVLVMEGSTIDHFSRLGRHATLSAGVTVLGSVEIGESAFIGGGSSIAPYMRIGAGALVGMGSAVISDVEPGSVVAGVPARELRSSAYRLSAD